MLSVRRKKRIFWSHEKGVRLLSLPPWRKVDQTSLSQRRKVDLPTSLGRVLGFDYEGERLAKIISFGLLALFLSLVTLICCRSDSRHAHMLAGKPLVKIICCRSASHHAHLLQVSLSSWSSAAGQTHHAHLLQVRLVTLICCRSALSRSSAAGQPCHAHMLQVSLVTLICCRST